MRGAEQLLCAERADAIIQAVRLKTIYHMVTMALETKAFVNLPGGSEVQLTALAFRSVRAEIATTLHRSERGVDRMIADSLALHEHLPAAAAGSGAVAVACPELTARTVGQIRVDVMRDLLLENCPANLPIPSSGGVKSTVRITIPALSLLGQSNEPATLDGYGPIDMDTARRIASEVPSFQRVLTDPFDSTVLDVEQCSYTPSAALKRWVMLRDQSCRFPGCNQPAWRAEIDHTVTWEHDGPTAYDNLACLCRNHHHLKHEGGWALTQQPQGVLRWVSPLGRIHYTHPATQIQVPAPAKPVPPPRPRNPHDDFNTPILTAPDDPPPF